MIELDDIPKEKRVTVWSRYSRKKSRYVHNHIENGFVSHKQRFPTAKSDEQKQSWNHGKWRKRLGYLDEKNKFIEL